MTKPIVIVAIRSNINWLEMNKSKFFAQGNTPITEQIFMPKGDWLTKHWKYIKLWDSSLNESYFSIRDKVQKFSEKTHSNIKNIDIVIKGKDSIFKFIKKYKNDRWIILPIDDDDFFNPDIANQLIDSYDSCLCDIITWQTILLNASNFLIRFIKQTDVFPSNSYMITNRVAKKVPINVLRDMISRHNIVKKKINKHSIKHFEIGENLSLYNKSPLSFSGTRDKVIEKKVIQEYFNSVKKSTNKKINYEKIIWIKPYVKGIQNILKGCFGD